MKTILYLTDLYYKANGRNYYEEDLYITSKLKSHFNILIGHPQQALAYLGCADLIVFRNTGPLMKYKNYFRQFVEEINNRNLLSFNSFDGKADMKGKDYLIQLTTNGFPVIPTVDKMEHIDLLGSTTEYILKLKDGADSIGMKRVSKEELSYEQIEGSLIQPYIDFAYEVSFYYLDAEFQYALYAPDKNSRWNLKEYRATSADLSFANRFIKWNDLTRGISRVDGCRLKDGRLLLVELEDLNPFLSLNALNEQKREDFISNFASSLNEAME